MSRIRVYVAGPYTNGNPAANTFHAQTVWDELWKAGYAPFCPHWSHYQHVYLPLPYEDWLAFDLEWLPLCHALLRIPGESAGADREVAAAVNSGLPVYASIADLLAGAPPEDV